MTNLLYKASIVTTPTAYGVGVLNSIKPAIPFGEELVVNGNFSDGANNWALGTGWSIGEGKAERLVAASSTDLVQASVFPNLTSTFRISFDVEATAGSVRARLGQTNLNYVVQGTHTFYAIPSGNDQLKFQADNSFIGSITNISVKEMIDADFDFTRNSSATRVNPDYLIETVSINSANLVQNGNFSELGAEAITNGNFANGSTGWSLNAPPWSIVNAKAVADGTSNNPIFQDGVITGGKQYSVTYTLSNFTQGSVYVDLGSGGIGATRTISGTYTEIILAAGNNTRFYLRGSGNFIVSIDNVSVKQVDPNDNWTLGTGWSIGTNVANANTSGNYVNLTQNNIFEVNKTYITTFTISAYTQGEVRLTQAGLNVSGLKSALGTYTTTYKAVSVGSEDQLIMQGLNSFVGSITDISIIEIQENGVPRLDYTNGTASILLEPQSTNLLTYSEDFSNAAWTKTGASVVSDATTSPDGSLNADKLMEDTSTGLHKIQVFYTFTAVDYSNSIRIKPNGTTKVSLWIDGASKGTKFDLSTGTIYSETSSLGKITALPNGWFEIATTADGTSGTSYALYFYDDSWNVTYTGDGTSGVYIWGAQAEALSYATSYIPTSGSTVTRAAETLNNAGNSDLINSTEGVLYVEIKALADDGTGRDISVSDNTGNNYARISLSNAVGNLEYNVVVGGVTQASGLSAISQTNFNKIALKYKLNDFAIWVNGTEVLTDSSGSVFPASTLTTLNFNRGSATNFFYGNCKTVAVFSESLSDTELACLTSTNNREIFLNYYYRMQYVGANTEAVNCAQIKLNI